MASGTEGCVRLPQPQAGPEPLLGPQCSCCICSPVAGLSLSTDVGVVL